MRKIYKIDKHLNRRRNARENPELRRYRRHIFELVEQLSCKLLVFKSPVHRTSERENDHRVLCIQLTSGPESIPKPDLRLEP